jgi:DNA-binding transcriptional regulator of glucitol operon
MDRRFLRPSWVVGHVLVVIAFFTCLRLAWWQLDRSEETTGTLQNVGYAILWPCFAVAFVYMWIRFLSLERLRADEEAKEHEESFARMIAEAEALTGAELPDGSVGEGADNDPGEAVVGSDFVGTDFVGTDFVGIVGEEDADDPELNAYNRALAALAEKDLRA